MPKDRPTRSLAHDDLWDLKIPADPQLSPDARQVAFVVTSADRAADENRSAIWTTPASRGRPRPLTRGPHDRAPRWSPGGRRLAFLAARDDKPPQVHVLDAAGGDPERLTELALGAGEPVWSPDGTRIAFTAPVRLRADAQDHDPIVVERLDHKADGAGRLGTLRMHLFVADTATRATVQLTFGDRSASTPVWSPDGQRLAFSAAAGADRDLRPASVVHIIPAAGGAATPVTAPDGLYQVAAWSPDGDTLLLTGQNRLSVGHDRLWSVPAIPGGSPQELDPGFDRNVMPGAPGYPGTTPGYDDQGRVVFAARERGAVHLLAVPARGGTPETLVGGDRVVAGASHAHGVLAYIAATSDSPGDVYVSGPGQRETRRLTTFFADAFPDVRLHPSTPFEATAPDGTPLHGWLTRESDAPTPGPVLLDIHGGPHNAWGPVADSVHLYHQTLAAKGWSILTLNPRGSDGYGEAFYTAVAGGWGTNDEADFTAALDVLVANGTADPGNIAVCGYSYGGYMTCWLTARTDRFRSAVAGGCVSDLISMAGTSDLGALIDKVELGASVLEDPARLREMSPLTYVEQARTPTLLLHGASDDRCPPGQAEQWFAALREQRVPTEMVLYPGASHLFILEGRPSHRVDYGRRIEEWVTRPGPRTRRAPADLRSRLAALAERHHVVGASLAVLAGGEVETAATGRLNHPAGIPATPESLFQIGSITKVYTTTLVMQLVDEGRVDLDAPVVEVLPELRLADPDVTKSVTMRHLLTHTSGIQGDHFPDTGRGDDCVARFVETCAELGQSHPLGATMSYCNSGFVIAGRVVEVLSGKTWDQALRERVVEPLGLTRTVTLPEEALLHATSTGHVAEPGKEVEVVPVWGLPRACGPAGLICATASDVIGFARAHMGEDGAAAPLLSPESVVAMQEPQVAIPDPYTLGSHWGIGWILFHWGGRSVYGHDGGTIGQQAFLRVVPDNDVAICLLTNGGNAGDLYQELFRGVLAEMTGVEMPERPAPPATPVEPGTDPDQHAGRYERLGVRIDVTVNKKGRLAMKTTVTGPLATVLPDPVTRYELVAVDENLFVTRSHGAETWTPVVFYRLDDGSRYIHFGGRATPKLA